jgi:sensor histidine kinase YesM
MISFDTFTALIMMFILAPIVGAITLLFMFSFEKRIDLLENRNKKIALEKELQQSLYNQLNQQIQPHFLFNALNVILSLARLKRTEELVRALEHLAAVLKFKYQTTEQLILLQQELTYTEHYIEIQKLRFGSRLQVSIECEPELKNCLILPFLIQTLVENAFKHALEKKTGEAILHIRLFSERETAVLQVIDNGAAGIGKHVDSTGTSGHGLNNIRRRLSLLFENQGVLTMKPGEEKGTVAEVRWPLMKA